MEISQLNYFLSICKHMNYTRAAKERYVSQPAISASVSRLEKELGVKLFYRDGRQLRLSEHGNILLEYSKVFMTNYLELLKKIEETKNNDMSLIRVGFSMRRSIFPMLGDFLLRHPGVNIQPFSVPYDQLVELLLSGYLDFCISAPPIRGENVVCNELCEEEIMIQIPKNHPQVKFDKVNLADFRHDKFMGFPKGYSFRAICDELYKAAGFIANYEIEFDTPSMNNLRKSSMAKSYVGLFPASLCGKSYDGDGHAVFRSVGSPKCYRTIAISQLSTRKQNHMVTELVVYFKKFFKINWNYESWFQYM